MHQYLLYLRRIVLLLDGITYISKLHQPPNLLLPPFHGNCKFVRRDDLSQINPPLSLPLRGTLLSPQSDWVGVVNFDSIGSGRSYSGRERGCSLALNGTRFHWGIEKTVGGGGIEKRPRNRRGLHGKGWLPLSTTCYCEGVVLRILLHYWKWKQSPLL